MQKTVVRKGSELIKLIHTTPAPNHVQDALLNNLMKLGNADQDEITIDKTDLAIILNSMLKIPAPPAKTTTFQWLSRAVGKKDPRFSLNYLNFRNGLWCGTDGHVLNMSSEKVNFEEGLYLKVRGRFATPEKAKIEGVYPDFEKVLGSLKIPGWQEADLTTQEYRSDCHSKGADRLDSVLIGDYWYRIKYVRIAQSHEITRDANKVMYVQSTENGALMINVSQDTKAKDHTELKLKSIVMPMRI